MPEVSRFFGIIITINYREHEPPHFHAWYSGGDIIVAIADGAVKGDISPRAVALVLEWWKRHQAELLEDWNLAQAGRALKKIAPLE